MGKKKIEDREISLEDAMALLEHPGAEKSSKAGSIDYSCGFDSFSLDDVRPADMVPFVRERFRLGSSGYVTVRHEAYLNSRSAEVEHVLKLDGGSILGTFGEKIVRNEPFRHASLRFSTAKFAGPAPSEEKRSEREYAGGLIGAFIRLGERLLGPLPDRVKEDAPESIPADKDYTSG